MEERWVLQVLSGADPSGCYLYRQRAMAMSEARAMLDGFRSEAVAEGHTPETDEWEGKDGALRADVYAGDSGNWLSLRVFRA